MLPQLDVTTFPSQLFWLFVSFCALYCVVKFLFYPNMSSILRSRALIEEGNFAEASKIKEEIQRQLALRDSQISLAKSKAQQIRASTKNKVLSMRAEFEIEVKRRIEEMQLKADADIAGFAVSCKKDALSISRGVAETCADKFSLSVDDKESLDNLTISFIENYYASSDSSN